MRIVFLLFLLISCSSHKETDNSDVENNSIVIELSFKNCSNEKTFYFLDFNEILLDSIQSTKNSREIILQSNFPKRIFISSEKEIESNSSTSFYFDLGINELIVDCQQPIDSIKIKGSHINDEYEELLEHKQAINKALAANFELVSFYSDLLKNTQNTTETDSIQNILSALETEKESLFAKSLRTELAYFKDKPNSFLAAYNLKSWVTHRYASDYMDDFKNIYQNLNPKVKQTEEATILGNYIDSFYKSAIGQPVPSIDLKDIANNEISLEKFKGKYVLLDFWASWCVPCIQDFPFLKALHSDYDSSLEIVSISLDKKIDSWKNAIEKYDLTPFTHISLEQNPDNMTLTDFYVKAIPVKILINPEGIIIGRWRGYDISYHDEIEGLIR